MLYAVHILGLGQWSRPDNAVGLSVVQLVVIGALCLLFTAPGGLSGPQTLGEAGGSSLLYMALIPGALAILAQTWAQAHLSATRTAVIMTMEPVWAAFFAILFGGESLTARMLVGGVLVLTAMYVVELTPERVDDGPDAESPDEHHGATKAPTLLRTCPCDGCDRRPRGRCAD